MSLVFRALLIWMMALAIPAQGFAAAAMVHCGPGHQRQQQSTIVVHHHGDAAATDDLSVADPTASAAHSGTGAERSQDHGRFVPHGKLSNFKCSACAACCVMLALLPEELSFGLIDVSPSDASDTFESCTGFVADGLERPPRTLLA